MNAQFKYWLTLSILISICVILSMVISKYIFGNDESNWGVIVGIVMAVFVSQIMFSKKN
jgi:hypothetical protein